MICEPIGDFAALSALAPEWRRLTKRAGSTPFQHPAFGLGWWEAFHPGKIAAAAFYRDHRLVALAPFYREEDTGRLLIIGMGLADYLDVIAEPDAETVSAVADFIDAADPPVSLEDLPPFSVLRGAEAERHMICPVSDLGRPLPASMRRSLALARNRIARRGAWDVECAQPPVPPDMLARLAAMHRARRAMLGHVSIFDDPRVVHWLARLANDADFPLRVYEARIGGAPAAFAVTLEERGNLYFWLLAMAPDFAFESPAKRLLGEVRDKAIAAGSARIFWLRGDEPYKAAWGAEPGWSYAIRRDGADGLRERP